MKNDKILIDHGSGGELSQHLITNLMLPAFDNPLLSRMDDGAVFEINGNRFAFSTDSYVVDPLFFPGGNIGDLAINGTVNDIAMCGATPLYLSTGLIIEEGFSTKDLETIVTTMKHAAEQAGVKVVTGDTKVVPKGAVDKIFINTSGLGLITGETDISGKNARHGDKIILSGNIADHGITILTQRENLGFELTISSDTAPLNHMVNRMISTSREIHVLRDPTRGGIGTALNEIACQSDVGIRIFEDNIPVSKSVGGVCDLLGFDPLYIANEGKLLAFVANDQADAVLSAVQEDPSGKNACIIGEVVPDHPRKVVMQTHIGGERIVGMLTGEQLPRIC